MLHLLSNPDHTAASDDTIQAISKADKSALAFLEFMGTILSSFNSNAERQNVVDPEAQNDETEGSRVKEAPSRAAVIKATPKKVGCKLTIPHSSDEFPKG
jgi:hypothetical protein